MISTTEETQIKDNKLVNELLPKDLSIYLVKDRWFWEYKGGLNSNDLYEQDFDSPLDALTDFIRVVLSGLKIESQSFLKQTQNFQDALNEALEDEPYDDEVQDKLTQISDILDNVIQDL